MIAVEQVGMLHADAETKVARLGVAGIVKGQKSLERPDIDDLDGGVHHALFLAGAQHHIHLFGRILVAKLRVRREIPRSG